MLDLLIKNLTELIKLHPTTHKDIKKEVIELEKRSTKAGLGRELQKEGAQQTEPTNIPPETKTLVTRATQTEVQTDEGHCKKCAEEQATKEEARAAAIVNLLNKQDATEEEMIELVHKEWPEKCFNKVKTKIGNPITSEHDKDVVLILKTKKEESALIDTAIRKYPSFQKMLEECSSPMDYLETETRTRKGTANVQRTYLVVGNEGPELMKAIEEVAQEALKENRTKLAIATTGSNTIATTRRYLKAVFRKHPIEVDMHVPPEREIRKKQGEGPTGKREDRKEWNQAQYKAGSSRQTIVIATTEGNKSYAEIAKEMKGEMNLTELGIVPKRISKTKAGNVKFTFTGKTENRECFKKKIGEQNYKIDVLQKTEQLMIKGLDEASTKEEIQTGIKAAINLDDIPIFMPEKEGPRFAIVTVPQNKARQLKAMKTVLVGWNRCRIDQMLSPPRCFKCQEYGHIARNCKQEEAVKTRGKCLNCWKDGHTAKSCNAEKPWCYVCKTEGHRAGTMKCPIYREAVREMAKNRRDGNKTNHDKSQVSANKHE